MGLPTSDPRSESRKLVAEYEQTLKSAKAEHQAAHEESGRRRRLRRAAVLTIALAVTAYFALIPPAWFKPAPIPPPTPAERSAGDRFAIYLQAQRIESFRSAKGRLPGTMEEAGEPMPGVIYELHGDGTYALTSERDQTLRFTSRDSLAAFVGGSLTLLGGDQP